MRRTAVSAALVLGLASASLCAADPVIFVTGFEADKLCFWSASTTASLCADPLPVDTVAWFYRATCPFGWTAYANAVGRTVVPSTVAHAGTTGGGAALASGEDRTHEHSVSSTLTFDEVSYVGAAGGGNSGVASSGSEAVTGTLAAVSLGIPYVQLLACQKTLLADEGPIPASSLLFTVDASCPFGFTTPSTALERLLVGLPTGGTQGATFGGLDLATASHGHSLSTSFHVVPHGIGLLGGCCAAGYAAAPAADVPFSDSVEAASAFPYLELFACTSQPTPPGPDLLPAGLLLFVEGAGCPAGWIPSPHASGRLVVGAGSGDGVGLAVGTALGDEEDRAHEHSFLLSLILPPKNIAAADGPNVSGAQSGPVPASGTSSSSTSGLPFVQVQACERVVYP